MKSLLLYALLAISFVYAADIESKGYPECLYCKNQDSKAGFLYSFEYCESKQLCLADSWDSFNVYCDTPWRQGWSLTIDEDC